MYDRRLLKDVLGAESFLDKEFRPQLTPASPSVSLGSTNSYRMHIPAVVTFFCDTIRGEWSVSLGAICK